MHETHIAWYEWAIDGRAFDLLDIEKQRGSALIFTAELAIVDGPRPYGFSLAELRMQSRRHFLFVRYRSTWLMRLCASMRIPWPPKNRRA